MLRVKKNDQCQLTVRETVYTLIGVIFCQYTEYKRISTSESNIIGVATTSAASTVEVTKRPTIPPVKKTKEYSVGAIHT